MENQTNFKKEVRFLGFELGKVLREQGDKELYNRVEKVRLLAKKRHSVSGSHEKIQIEKELRETVASYNEEELAELGRALALYFDLANLAEDRQRIRILRQRENENYPSPRLGSFGSALETLANRGVSASEIRERLLKLRVEPVFTAHPTEAKRRSVRDAIIRIRKHLAVIDSEGSLIREKETAISGLRAELSILWHTETLMDQKPSVRDEARWSLVAMAPNLWDAIPRIYRQVRRVLGWKFPNEDFSDLPGLIRFGSWIGGDRDGNPFVDAQTTEDILRMTKNSAIDLHLNNCNQLMDILSVSCRRVDLPEEMQLQINEAKKLDGELFRRLKKHHAAEGYRIYLELIARKLEFTQEELPGGYRTKNCLLLDLKKLKDSLNAVGFNELVSSHIQPWIDRTNVFGLQLWKLDIREDSGVLSETIEALSAGYLEMNANEQVSFFSKPIDVPTNLDLRGMSEAVQKTIHLFDLLARLEEEGRVEECINCFITAMTHKASDVLGVAWLWNFARTKIKSNHINQPIPINMVPLLETIDDLKAGPDLYKELLKNDVYMASTNYLKSETMIMVGYSDSCKDGGNLMSNWCLYNSQEELAKVAKENQVRIIFFHGRGGALGRGGGHAAKSITSLPPGSVGYAMRVTEQGEVLSDRYDDSEITVRHLEQLLFGVLTASEAEPIATKSIYANAIQKAADHGMQAYRALRNDSFFMDYFGQATPIDVIEKMPMGSRPSRRKARKSLDDLRAIPYTFAWTQTRQLITALYGVGTGLSTIDQKLLKEMFSEWNFFKNYIENILLALAKGDESVAHWYSELPVDQENASRVEQLMTKESSLVKNITTQLCGGGLEAVGAAWLAEGVKARNPYVDCINAIQVELLKRKADPSGNALRMSLQGIAAGLRTTG